MFVRNNLIVKYRKYTKTLQNIKNSLTKTDYGSSRNTVELFNETQYYSAKNQRFQQLKDYCPNLSKILTSIQDRNKSINQEKNNKFTTKTDYGSSRNTVELFNETQYYSAKNQRFQQIKDYCPNLSKILTSIQDRNKSINQEKNSKFTKNPFLYAASGVDVATGTNTTVLESIPEPPPSPVIPIETIDATQEVINQVNALGEPTFASLGLGGYTPVGIVQTCLEYLHVTLGVPWWETVVLGTIVIRTLLFPLVVVAQRNAAKMNNYLPQLQAIQLKMTEARQMGNQLEVARYSQEMMLFMKEKNLNPLKNMIVPLAQMPVFISFFIGLRQMANVPVESLRTGGLWWFTDLTVPDQFFLMPIITSLTLYATIELGTDSAKLSSQNLQTMRYVLRALPIVILPFIVNFPGAILCYWVSSNFISLGQVGLLRIPAVRDYFKIEQLVTHRPENLPMKPKGFTEGIKESWTNMKISNELEERRRLDDIQFQRAGKGPIVKTFKYDPTKQMVNAKKRDT